MDNKIKTFQDLFAWKKGHEMVLEIYQLTKSFPSEEKFGLVSQVRRASVSVTSNLAEGFGRRWRKEKIHFYDTSLASLYEVQNQLLIVRDVGFISMDQFNKLYYLTQDTQRLINALIRSIASSGPS